MRRARFPAPLSVIRMHCWLPLVLALGLVGQCSSFLMSSLAVGGQQRASAVTGLRSACMGAQDPEPLRPAQTRRQALSAGLLALTAPVLPLALPTAASAEGGTLYEDKDRGFTLDIPSGWTQATAEFPGASRNPARPKILSFISPENKDVNLAIVSYSIQPDYEKLGSLGSLEDVAGTLIGRSGNLDAEMYSQKEKKVGGAPAYVFDYRIKDKHLLTVFGIRAGQWAGNYLVTLTVQAPKDTFPSVEKTLRDVVASFKLNPL